jgi:hypothetical protein
MCKPRAIVRKVIADTTRVRTGTVTLRPLRARQSLARALALSESG